MILEDATGLFGEGVARVRLTTFGPLSNYLRATGFGFALPSTAIVNGITAEIRRASREGSPPKIRDSEIKLINRGVILPTNRSAAEVWTDEFTYVTYGGPTDLWGHDWTPTDINQADFGLALRASYTTGAGNDDALVDHVRITVHYADSCP